MNDSPVISLLATVYKNSNEAKGHSWRLLNDALQTCLGVAIHSQFKFETSDFQEISKRFNFGYWGGSNSDKMFAEGYYALAVNNKNRSACISFEIYKGRKPYILNGERLAWGSDFLFCETPIRREKGFRVFRVHVTYIGPDCIGFCWYDNPGNHQKGKPNKRWTLTLSELKRAQKEGRAALTPEHFRDWIASQEAKQAEGENA